METVCLLVKTGIKQSSDIDLAVSGGNISRFSIENDEETKNLLEYDVVNLDGRVQEELLKSIQKNVAHAYNQDIAIDIVNQAKNTFYHMFEELKSEIEENWG